MPTAQHDSKNIQFLLLFYMGMYVYGPGCSSSSSHCLCRSSHRYCHVFLSLFSFYTKPEVHSTQVPSHEHGSKLNKGKMVEVRLLWKNALISQAPQGEDFLPQDEWCNFHHKLSRPSFLFKFTEQTQRTKLKGHSSSSSRLLIIGSWHYLIHLCCFQTFIFRDPSRSNTKYFWWWYLTHPPCPCPLLEINQRISYL